MNICHCGASIINGHHCENGHLQDRDFQLQGLTVAPSVPEYLERHPRLPTEDQVLTGVREVISMLGLTFADPDIRKAIPVLLKAYTKGFKDGSA